MPLASASAMLNNSRPTPIESTARSRFTSTRAGSSADLPAHSDAVFVGSPREVLPRFARLKVLILKTFVALRSSECIDECVECAAVQ